MPDVASAPTIVDSDPGFGVIMLIERRCVQFDVATDALPPRFVDGKELPRWQVGPTMPACLQQLEREGWNFTGEHSGQAYVFERQVVHSG